MWGRVMVETATEVKISKTTKLKAVFDAFLNGLFTRFLDHVFHM